MIGRLRSVVVDCPDPSALASFYSSVLGASVLAGGDDTWVVIVDSEGRRIAFQQALEYKPPRFPDPSASQQFHLDIVVDDVEVAEPQVLALGAELVQANDSDWFRVYRDPAGHTFCLVWFEQT